MKKIRQLIGVGFVFLSILVFWSPPTVTGDEQASEVTITLHKRIWIDQELPANLVNNGLENHSFGGTPLANVSFSVYDATDRYQEASRQADFDVKTWMKGWAQKSIVAIQQAGLTQIGQTSQTNGEGSVSFRLPQDQANAYLFVQEPIVSKTLKFGDDDSAPLIVIVPYYAEGASQPLETIHIYLKNAATSIQPVTPAEPKQPILKPTKQSFLPSTGQAKSLMAISGMMILFGLGWYLWRRPANKEK